MTHTSSVSRWTILLALLLVAILLEPLFGRTVATEVGRLGLVEIVVVSALYTTKTVRTARVSGVAVAVAWLAASLLAMVYPQMVGLVTLFSMVLLSGALVVTFRNLLSREDSDLETLVGGIFGYVLLAVVWAMLYFQIERWQPGSFLLEDDILDASALMYFSFATVTTLGYGDILPVGDLSRIAAAIEAVVGVLYVAVMIGSIVGSLNRRH